MSFYHTALPTRSIKRQLLAAIMLLAGVAVVGGVARADINTFTLRQPLTNATVREKVPIRVPRNLLNNAGYATVTIDGQFRAAPAIPPKGDVIYYWDTKHPFTTTDKPDVQQTTEDGSHVVTVDLFDKDSNEIARGAAKVRVANKIRNLPDGVHLIYKWRRDEVATYRLQDAIKNGDGPSATPVQTVDAKLQRSVEDLTGATALLRDHFIDGTIGDLPLTSAYNLASKYWTVDKYGVVLAENKPIAAGDHFGYAISQFPPRRVNAGDSWQTKILTTLQWASEKMTTLHGKARLDDFEWQDGYPTAKIVETYSGPAVFNLTAPESGMPPVQATSVQLTRTVWFAYEAGMIVRVESKMTSATQMGSDQLAALSVTTPAVNPNAQPDAATGDMNPTDSTNGDPYAPAGATPGRPYYPGATGGPVPGMPYGRPGMPYGRPGTPYGGPGMPYGGPPAATQQTQSNSVKLTSDATLTLIGISR